MVEHRFIRLAVATAVASYFLVILGGLVRATGAGLACPDWPLCHGRLIPPLEGLILVEYSHRLVASLVGILTLLLAGMAWRFYRGRVEARIATVALLLVFVQIALGGLTVRGQLSSWIVVAHLGTAMTYFATIVWLAASVLLGTSGPRSSGFSILPRLTLAATFVLILLGGYVSVSRAGLACPDWPLCYGQLLPAMTGPVAVHMLHRFAAAVVAVLLFATVLFAYRTQGTRPQVLAAALVAAVLLVIQIILGALNVQFRLTTAVTTAHLATAAAFFAALVVLVFLADRAPRTEYADTDHADSTSRARSQPVSPRRHVLDYISLTKPRIIVLLLIVAFASMLIASPGAVSPWVVVFTMVGGALSAGSANAVNCLLDRDIDALMSRTRKRPLPARRIEPSYAFAFAVILGIVAFVVFAVLVNLLSAVLAMVALFFYVGIYTVWLKRATPQNIVIGGAAGAMPPLIGWAAATGRVELPALVLFLIVFLWTPPHFWALALYRHDDYARAGVPMLPVIAGEEETRRQIVIYSLLLVTATLLLFPLGTMGWLYALAALMLGGGFVTLALHLQRQRTVRSAVQLFGYSLVYLALLFGAMAADRILRG